MTVHGYAALCGLLALTSSARTHDYWLRPGTFFPEAGKVTAVRLHVGDKFESEAERAHDTKRTVRFQLLSKKETVDLTKAAKDGQKPVAEVNCQRAGDHWIGLERSPVLIQLEADKFDQYLEEEGLKHVRDERKRRGEEGRAGRERYSRYLKCLMRVGEGDGEWKRVLGHRLEVVALTDPCAPPAGGKLGVRVLFDGKPLAGVSVFALHRDGKNVAREERKTDADGGATFIVERKGEWLIRLVHMRRAAEDKEADWESFWAALTFAVR